MELENTTIKRNEQQSLIAKVVELENTTVKQQGLIVKTATPDRMQKNLEPPPAHHAQKPHFPQKLVPAIPAPVQTARLEANVKAGNAK